MSNLHLISRDRVKNIHFVGIAGLGMSGIAEVLNNLGYNISGSDLSDNKTTDRLAKMGCKIHHTHHQDNIKNAEAVVVSSAIGKNNVEIIAAKKHNLPIVPRAEMLADLMRFRFGIAVAGTHGKTTTTSIITHIMSTAKLDPTYIIGGILKSSGINAKLGEGDYLIAEADESDASFLHLQPMLSVITNIDQDHMATYANDYQKLKHAFVDFTTNLPFYGACVMCVDDIGVSEVINDIHRPIVSYGIENQADMQAINITQIGKQMHFDVVCKKYQKTFSVKLNLIGKHNILNTLAAIGICCELDIEIDVIQTALRNFSGVARRLDYQGTLFVAGKNVLLFDDYGHHPNEIKAVFESLKNTYKNNNLVVIFQPHRYSRTRDLFDDFAHTLSTADALILLDIYPANEKPIAHINVSTLADAIRKRSNLDPVVVKKSQEVLTILPNIIADDDVLLVLGAGDIYTLPDLLKSHYATP